MIDVAQVWVASWLPVCVAALLRAVVFASGENVGANVQKLLMSYASELYVGIVAIVGVMFLANRRYNELALFLFATVVVAWLVFDPSGIATAAEGIGKQIFG